MAGGAGEVAVRRWRLSRRAAALRTHPLVLASLVLLVVNDHVLKARWPDPATGVASDVAGLVLLPVVLVLIADAARTRPLPVRTVALIGLAVAIGFAAVELLPIADAAYELGLGLAGWPVRALFGGGGLRVVATPDPLDLLTLPFAASAVWLWGGPVIAPRPRPVAPNRGGRSARLGAAVMVLLAPALLATSPEPRDIEAETTMPGPLVLDADHPTRSLVVTVESNLDAGDARRANVELSLPHRAGEPAILMAATSDEKPAPVLAHVASVSEGLDVAESGVHVELGSCRGRCRLQARIMLQLVGSTPGSWSHPLSAFATLHGPAEGKVTVRIEPEGDSAPPPSRVLASGLLRSQKGAAGEGSDVLVIRSRPAISDPSFDDPDAAAGSEPVIVAMADVADDRAIQLAAHGQNLGWVAHDAFTPGGWELAPAQCGQAIPACEEQVLVFAPTVADDPAGAATPFALDVVDGRADGAPPLAVEVIPARWDFRQAKPGDALSQQGFDVTIPPGQTLLAMVRRPKGAPTTVSGDQLELEVALSDGTRLGPIRQPAPTTLEACPAAAAAACTVHLTWTMADQEPVQIDTVLIDS